MNAHARIRFQAILEFARDKRRGLRTSGNARVTCKILVMRCPRTSFSPPIRLWSDWHETAVHAW
jgi:hypothetical protein